MYTAADGLRGLVRGLLLIIGTLFMMVQRQAYRDVRSFLHIFSVISLELVAVLRRAKTGCPA